MCMITNNGSQQRIVASKKYEEKTEIFPAHWFKLDKGIAKSG